MSSGPMISSKMTLELIIDSQNICWRIVCWVLMNTFLLQIFYKKGSGHYKDITKIEGAFVSTDMNGLTLSCHLTSPLIMTIWAL